MAFVIKKKKPQPVEISLGEGNSFILHIFSDFSVKKLPTLRKLMAISTLGGQDTDDPELRLDNLAEIINKYESLLSDLVVSWEGVTDEAGSAVPFTKETLSELFEMFSMEQLTSFFTQVTSVITEGMTDLADAEKN